MLLRLQMMLPEERVIACVGLEARDELSGDIRAHDSVEEGCQMRVYDKGFVSIGGVEIGREEERPLGGGIGIVAATDGAHMGDFQQMHACLAHHPLDLRRLYGGSQSEEGNVVNHRRLLDTVANSTNRGRPS